MHRICQDCYPEVVMPVVGGVEVGVKGGGGYTGYHCYAKMVIRYVNTNKQEQQGPFNQENMGNYSRLVSSSWKALPKNQKERWENIAKEENEREGSRAYVCAKCMEVFKREDLMLCHEK